MKEFTCSAKKLKAIVSGVFAPYSTETVKGELQHVKYVTVYTDASNHGDTKIFPIVVRYFDPLVGVKVKALDVQPKPGETSQIIFEFIQKVAEDFEIQAKIVAFCGDNAKVNFGGLTRGGKNNVFYKMKEKIPDLIGIGCNAHITHNSIKKACDVALPFDIEHIIVKIYSHFYLYSVRTETLKEFCQEAEIEYEKLLGYAKTRFLALRGAIRRIIQLFDALKLYFNSLTKGEHAIKAFFEKPDSKFWLLFVAEQVV